MPDIYTMTAPLVYHDHINECHLLIAELFPCCDGIVFFEPYWREFPSSHVVHKIQGTLKGDGPWKIADATITVLSCSEPELAMAWQDWQAHIQLNASLYEDDEFKIKLAASWGALIE